MNNILIWGHSVIFSNDEKKDFIDKFSPEFLWRNILEVYESIKIPEELSFKDFDENSKIGMIFWGLSGLLFKHFDWVKTSNLTEKIKDILIKHINIKIANAPRGLNVDNFNLKQYYPPIPSLLGLSLLFEKEEYDRELIEAIFDGFNNIRLFPVLNCYSNVINKVWKHESKISLYLLCLGIELISNDNKNKENLIEEFKQKYFNSSLLIFKQNIEVTQIKQYIDFTTFLYFIPLDKLENEIKVYLKEFITMLLIYRINLKTSTLLI